MKNIEAFDRKLKELTRYDPEARPFLCKGFPFGCDIFLVGINPATTTSFWDYWSPKKGCDKESWITKYIERHGKFSPTRKRIELFFEYANPLKVLETNIFPFPSARENELKATYRDTTLFDYLIETIQPKIIVAHGASTIKHLSKFYGKDLKKSVFTTVSHQGTIIDVRVENHFSYQWSFNAIKNLAVEIKNRYA